MFTVWYRPILIILAIWWSKQLRVVEHMMCTFWCSSMIWCQLSILFRSPIVIPPTSTVNVKRVIRWLVYIAATAVMNYMPFDRFTYIYTYTISYLPRQKVSGRGKSGKKYWLCKTKVRGNDFCRWGAQPLSPPISLPGRGMIKPPSWPALLVPVKASRSTN